MRAFSRDALQHYVPVIQKEVSACLARWLGAAGPCLLVYPEVKRLMFRIAMRILLGFQPRQASPDGEQQLVEAFEEMIRNLFSLPIDVPFSGLYRVRLTAGQEERGAPSARAGQNREGRDGSTAEDPRCSPCCLVRACGHATSSMPRSRRTSVPRWPARSLRAATRMPCSC